MLNNLKEKGMEMKIDWYTKFVLSAIAIGLFLNFASPIIAPKIANAEIDSSDLDAIERYLRAIKSNLRKISSGACVNSKIC